MGPFNGISDGSAGVIGLFVLMGFVGNNFWLEVLSGSFRIVDIAFIAIFVG